MPPISFADRNSAPARDRSLAPVRSMQDTWVDVLVGLACVLPLLITAHLPLVDLPGHLARQFVIRDLARSPDLQTFYSVHWALVPNLALELFVLGARRVMSIDMAVRAFCIATMLLIFLGARLVNRTLSGGQGRVYRLAPLLCYGGPFQYGFLSYCFGVGLALLFFGCYLRIRTQSFARLAIMLAPLGFVLLLCHLVAFGLFAIAIGACELTHGFIEAGGVTRRLPAVLLRRQLSPIASLVPVFLVFVWLSPTSTDAIAENVVHFSSLHDKARSFASIMLLSSPILECGLLALAFVGLAAALWTRTVRLHPIAVTAVAIMVLVWLALPSIAFGAAFIDYRLPWAFALFLLAGLVPSSGAARWSGLAGWYFGSLAVVRIGMIAALWLSWEPTLTALDGALASLPPGARLMVVEGRLPNGGVFRQPTLTRFASYAVARSHAFDPGLFANMSGQILYFQPHFLQLWERDNLGESPDSLDAIEPDYNYVLVLVPELASIAPTLPLACQVRGPHFTLFKVMPAGALTDEVRQGRCPQ